MDSYRRPESVLVVVWADNGAVLLLERRYPPGFWQSVTGGLEWEETAEHAARRELGEETGLTAVEGLQDCRCTNRYPILPEWRSRYAPHVSHNVEHVFSLRFPKPVPVKLNLGEHRDYRWFPRRDALCKVASWSNRDAIRDLVIAGERPGDD